MTYARLRAMGNNDVQLPVKEFKDGKLIGTEMLHIDGKFSAKGGKAEFKPAAWPGVLRPIAVLKEKYKFWINNGRLNETWQTMYHTSTTSLYEVACRWPISK